MPEGMFYLMGASRTHLKSYRLVSESELGQAVNLFLLDCEARGLTPASLRYYWQRLGLFVAFLETQNVTTPGAITPAHVRAYFLTFTKRHLSPHYLHGAARSAKTFLRFCELEDLIAVSPMRRVKMPRLPKDALPPFTATEVGRLLYACENERDRAVVLVLLDSGVRASELCALDVADVDMTTGRVHVRQGKGRKDRDTFIGARTRKALVRYLMTRNTTPDDALFVGFTTDERLTVYGLQSLIRRVARRADVLDHGLHRFRRTFAIESLRAKMPIMQLAAMMGHGSLPVLQRYLRLLSDDLADAHREHGPVDNLLTKGKGKR